MGTTHPIFESDFDCLTDGSLKATKFCTMPGVQDAYSIDVTNRFGLVDLGDDSGSECENVDPFEALNQLNAQAAEAKAKAKNQPKTKGKKVVTKKAENKIENKAESGDKNNEKDSKNMRKADDRNRGNNRRGRGDGRPRSDRPESDRPRREPRDGEENSVRQYRNDDRPRRGGRGGRGVGGDRRQPRREFDRKSADPKAGNKGSEKKEGSGAYNWGTEKDELEGQVAEKGEAEAVSSDSPKEDTEQQEPKEPEEVEPPTLTLDEYRSQKRNVISNSQAKTAPQTSDDKQKDDEAREHKKKGRASRVEQVVYDVAPLVQRGGGRGRGRGRGGGRDGGRDGGRGPYRGDNKKAEKQGFSLEDDFPTLG